MMEKGRLFIVSTPIGNLEDITLRALRILKESDLIAAEDTRHTRGLLSHYEIHTPLTSLHIYNEHQKIAGLLEQVLQGKDIAVVSDAGTPGISDPGFLIVREARKAGVEVVVIPGVSAVIFAAVAGGLELDEVAFYGFPPVKSGRRGKFFERLALEDKTVFFYESPYRIKSALDYIVKYCGESRRVAIIREATKLHEEVLTGNAGELQRDLSERVWKGEFVIGVGRADGRKIEEVEE